MERDEREPGDETPDANQQDAAQPEAEPGAFAEEAPASVEQSAAAEPPDGDQREAIQPEAEPMAAAEEAPAEEAAEFMEPVAATEPVADYYAVLGVPAGSSRRVISEAYDRLARELQPDERVLPADPERMAKVDEAFDFLDNAERRAEYDRSLGIESTPEVRRGRFADRGVLLAVALIVAGIGAMIAAGFVLFVDLSGGDDTVTTDSGLQYVDQEVGDGPQPKAGDELTVEYVGMLEDGSVFDDSRENGEPFTFVLGRDGLIPGWEEGIATMRQGGKRKLIIPPALAYGEEGLGDIIPANATLIFEVELLAVNEAPSPTPALPTQAPTTAPEAPPEVTGDEITTGSGLKYIDIQVGSGEAAATGATVVVNYTGWLADGGTKFDSSLERSEPFSFPLGAGRVIAGWDEGVDGMKVGGKRRLIVPSDLGYGAQGYPPVIPANATLIFDVELLDVR